MTLCRGYCSRSSQRGKVLRRQFFCTALRLSSEYAPHANFIRECSAPCMRVLSSPENSEVRGWRLLRRMVAMLARGSPAAETCRDFAS